jgi:hypothetical protein
LIARPDEVLERAPEAVQLPHDEDVALAAVVEGGFELGPLSALVPEAFLRKIRSQPRASSAESCGESSCSEVETLAYPIFTSSQLPGGPTETVKVTPLPASSPRKPAVLDGLLQGASRLIVQRYRTDMVEPHTG